MQGETISSLHVFIVPDGNRRWADARNVTHWAGYAAGRNAFRAQAHTIWDHGVTHVTVWGMSLGNLMQRNSEDIGAVFNILGEAVAEFFEEIPTMEKKIRFRAVGDWRFRFPSRLSRPIEELEVATKQHTERTVTLLLAYDGGTEFCDTLRRARAYPPYECDDPESLKRISSTHFLPNVDIFLRTGGEPHLSGNALPFQMRDPELFFPKKYWPDFTLKDMAAVIAEYKERRRRHGA